MSQHQTIDELLAFAGEQDQEVNWDEWMQHGITCTKRDIEHQRDRPKGSLSTLRSSEKRLKALTIIAGLAFVTAIMYNILGPASGHFMSSKPLSARFQDEYAITSSVMWASMFLSTGAYMASLFKRSRRESIERWEKDYLTDLLLPSPISYETRIAKADDGSCHINIIRHRQNLHPEAFPDGKTIGSIAVTSKAPQDLIEEVESVIKAFEPLQEKSELLRLKALADANLDDEGVRKQILDDMRREDIARRSLRKIKVSEEATQTPAKYTSSFVEIDSVDEKVLDIINEHAKYLHEAGKTSTAQSA